MAGLGACAPCAAECQYVLSSTPSGETAQSESCATWKGPARRRQSRFESVC